MELVIVLAIVIAILVVAAKGSKQLQIKRQDAAWTSACNDPEVQKIVETLAQDVLPVVPAPIALERGESCFFHAPVQYQELRTVTKSVSYAGVTSRVRILKGTYLRAGSFVPNRVTAENMVHQDTGTLYFTNDRLIFTGQKRNLTITRKTILAIKPYRDAIEVEKTAGRSPIFQNSSFNLSICMNAAALRFMTLHEGHANNAPAPKAASANSTPVLAGKTLTNDDVLALKHAGLGDELIVEKIKSSPGYYGLETTDLVALKQAGITDPVISAMIQAMER